MSRFRAYESSYDLTELAIFQQAYDDACRKLGLDPAPADDDLAEVHNECRALRRARPGKLERIRNHIRVAQLAPAEAMTAARVVAVTQRFAPAG